MTQPTDRDDAVVTIDETPDGVRCLARPRGWAVPAFGAFMVLLTGFLGGQSAYSTLWRGMRRRQAENEWITVAVVLVPFLLSLVVFILIMRRRNAVRGVEIVGGVVTLHTPDMTTSKQSFDLSNFAGTELVRTGINQRVNLQVLRREGAPIPVLNNYWAVDLGPVVDALNRMVVDDRHHGFEVIPMAQRASSSQTSSSTAPPPDSSL